MTSSNLPASPLSRILAQARATPRETGRTSLMAGRFGRASDACVVCADTSSSMAEVARGAERKIDMLRSALASVAAGSPGLRCIMFGGHTAWASPADVGAWQASGSTPLHAALDLANTLSPRQTLVITDGHPDDADAALAVARQLSGRIDVLFIGPTSDHVGQEFCRRLARIGVGTMRTFDLMALGRGGTSDPARELASATRQVLALPPGPAATGGHS